MKKSYLLLCCLFLGCQFSLLANPLKQVNQTLDQFHQAASEADGAQYFSLLHENAVFIGTDATERWTKNKFEQFAKPYFDKGIGWKYLPRNRHVNFSKDNTFAWFDELLDSNSYGECRGTGVLELTDAGWKISQYHLTIPIPNDLADGMVKKIKEYTSKK